MSHYHLASLFILPDFRPHAGPSLAHARAAGLTTSLDTNWDPRGAWMKDLAPCLPDLDFLFMNEDEARMLRRHARSRSCLAACERSCVKLGPRGCAILRRGGEILSPAFDVDVKDTTGAGDSFVAGFLAAHLRGGSLEEVGPLRQCRRRLQRAVRRRDRRRSDLRGDSTLDERAVRRRAFRPARSRADGSSRSPCRLPIRAST